MDKDLKKVVILLAHPNMKESQANKALTDAVKDMDEVAVYNLYWMSAPSLLKKWQDEVFTYLAKTPAVAGKPLMVVTTTGSEFEAYRSGGRNRFTVDELLRPYQVGAIHAGMVWQTPIIAYGMGTTDAAKNIAEGANLYRQKVERLIGTENSGNNW